MKTYEEVQKDLIEIRYYNANRDRFDSAAKIIGPNRVITLFEEYNLLIQRAPLREYELYLKLYVEGLTYEVAAENLGYSTNYIFKGNKRLVEFLLSKINC